MLILIGKTASGKTALQNILSEKYGFNKLITYTTRPKRTGEDDNTYHFILEEDFLDKVKRGFFLEYKKYHTTEGIWYYGSAKEDYVDSDMNTVIILTPDGVKDLMKYKTSDMKVVYIYSNVRTIMQRLEKRGDDREEIKRRISADNHDFRDAYKLADGIVHNRYNSDLNDIADRIIKIYKDEGGA